MEILLILILVVVIYNTLITGVKLRELKREVIDLQSKLGATKQAKMKSSVRSSSTPPVDSRGRTTRRDTNDIPARGARMTTLTRKRKASVSPANDDRLPDDPGPSPA